MFSFIAIPLGYVMEFVYVMVQNYGWALILFTVLLRVVMFPLSIKQQKSTAKMSAYQPMIKEIQVKYAKDQQRQNEEMMRLQQEFGFSPTAGCVPMLVNFLIIFGVIDVVYKPLTYILHISDAAITAIQTAAQLTTTTPYQVQSAIISAVQANPEAYVSAAGADVVSQIANFNFIFFGIDLSQIPTLAFNALIIIPALSVITMILSQIVTMKASGQEMQGAMKIMPWMMSAMFVWFGFTVPVAFSLYYTISNVMMVVQSVVLKKMYDPEKYKAQLAEQIEAKKAEKKKKKVVTVKTQEGSEEKKEVSESQLAALRLQLAREMDEKRYADERTVPLTEEEKAARAEKLNAKPEKKSKKPAKAKAEPAPAVEAQEPVVEEAPSFAQQEQEKEEHESEE